MTHQQLSVSRLTRGLFKMHDLMEKVWRFASGGGIDSRQGSTGNFSVPIIGSSSRLSSNRSLRQRMQV
jgi:hypothetical protein